MNFGELTRLAVDLSLQGNFSSGISRATSDLSRFNTSVSRTGSAIATHLGQGVRTGIRNLERLALAAAAMAAGGGIAAVKWAGDFEAGMRTINTVALATPDVLKKAGEGIRTIFRDTGQSMADLQAAEYDLVSAGIKLQDAQIGLTQAVRLGQGALGSTSEAVDVLTTAINAYNLKAADGTVATATWTKVSDELAQAVADGKVKLSEIASTYAQVAPIAAQAGISTGEVAAALGFLTAKGTPAAEVMTQMARSIIELQKPSAALSKLQKELGVNFADVAREKGLAVALEQMRVAAEKAGVPFIELFGRVEAYKFALQTTGPNQAGFAAEMVKIGNSAGATSKQFDERAQGLNFQMARLKANVQDAGITIGTALIPKLADLAKKAADFLSANRGAVESFGRDLASGLESAVHWAEKLDWKGIALAVKGLGSFAKSLAEGFMAMPTEAKELLLGLYGLNKLSGGAVINIGLDVTKGVLGQFLARGSMINPMFVVPMGGGLGGPGGPVLPGGGPGLLGKLVRGAIGVTIVALTAEAALQISGINDPKHRQIDPVTGQPTGPLFRGTNIGSEQLAFQEQAAARLRERIAGGETGIVVKQLAAVEAEIAKLRGDVQAGTAAGQAGGKSPEDRQAAADLASAAVTLRAFGIHADAATAFGSKELKAFRGTAEGAISLFDERVKYLAGAQGAGAGSEKYLALVQRDIDALKTILPTATGNQGAIITGEIVVLEGILKDKKFLAPELVAAVQSSSDRTNQHLEDNRASTERGASAMQRAADALERKQQTAANITVNVTAQFTARDGAKTTSRVSRLGYVAS